MHMLWRYTMQPTGLGAALWRVQVTGLFDFFGLLDLQMKHCIVNQTHSELSSWLVEKPHYLT